MSIVELSYSSHDEWLQLRMNYIGGSDAGAVIGANPYKSAYALWAEKTGRIPEFQGNLITEVGSYLESFVAKLFEKTTGKKVRKKNRILVNEKYPFACADVDRMIVGEKALLEIKTTNSFLIMRQLRSTEFPDAYYAQCVHYLAVTGWERIYLAVLVNCRDFKIYCLERDQDEINALMSAEKEFWKMVREDTAPAPDGADSTAAAINTLYPESTEKSVNLDELDNALEAYMSYNAQVKVLASLRDEQANIIKEYMKEAGRGESDRFKVSYITSERRTFDTKRFEKEHNDIDLQSYYKTSTSRMFKVIEKGA